MDLEAEQVSMNDTSDVTVIRPTLAYLLNSTLLPALVCAAPIALLMVSSSSRNLILTSVALAALVVGAFAGWRLLKIRVVITEYDVTFFDPDKQLHFIIFDILGYEVEKNKAETYLIIKQEFESSEKFASVAST
jgi:hypothetical protein